MPCTEAGPEASHESVWRLRAILSASREGILVQAADGRTLYANERLAAITGVPLAELYGQGANRILRPDPTRHTGTPAGTEDYDLVYDHPEGEQRTLSVAVSPLHHEGRTEGRDDAEVTDVLTLVSDVTETRRTEERLRWQALHDPLTGLPNRALLVDRLEMASARQERGSARIAVLFLDLDDFKAVNDRHGHEGGDQVLAEVSKRLGSAVRRADTVARWGGDEFVVVCEDADEEVAAQIAQRILEALQLPVALAGGSLEIGASIGIAVAPPYEANTLLRSADAAMYDAKTRRAGPVVVFDPTA